jgi:glycosyltransferase involved in cell wall biosynthesis
MVKKNMHICHIVNKLTYTSGILDQINGLVERGVRITVISFMDEGEVSKEIIADPRIVFWGLGNKSCLLKKLFLCKQIINRNNFDVVQCRHSRTGFFIALLSKVCVFNFIFQDGAERKNYKIGSRLLISFAEALAKRVICVSKSVAASTNFIENFFISQSKKKVIYFGTEAERYSLEQKKAIRANLGVSSFEYVFSHTGRFVRVKRQAELLEKFALILQRLKLNACLILAGDGPEKQSLISKVRELKIEDRVFFLGMIPRDKIHELLDISQFFIMNSITEGHSVSLVEALAYGVIPILSDITSFRETMKKGYAIFFDEKQKHINLLEEVFKNGLKDYSLQNIAMHKERYSKDRMIDDYIAFYHIFQNR